MKRGPACDFIDSGDFAVIMLSLRTAKKWGLVFQAIRPESSFAWPQVDKIKLASQTRLRKENNELMSGTIWPFALIHLG